jgi:hypothetical protein
MAQNKNDIELTFMFSGKYPLIITTEHPFLRLHLFSFPAEDTFETFSAIVLVF